MEAGPSRRHRSLSADPSRAHRSLVAATPRNMGGGEPEGINAVLRMRTYSEQATSSKPLPRLPIEHPGAVAWNNLRVTAQGSKGGSRGMAFNTTNRSKRVIRTMYTHPFIRVHGATSGMYITGLGGVRLAFLAPRFASSDSLSVAHRKKPPLDFP